MLKFKFLQLLFYLGNFSIILLIISLFLGFSHSFATKIDTDLEAVQFSAFKE